MIKKILKHFDFSLFREDARKIGVNFITTGIAGVFINHIVGNKTSSMLYASISIAGYGTIFLLIGLYRRKEQ